MLNEMICDYRKSTFQYLDIFNITFHSAVHQSGQGVRPERAGAAKVSPGSPRSHQSDESPQQLFSSGGFHLKNIT